MCQDNHWHANFWVLCGFSPWYHRRVQPLHSTVALVHPHYNCALNFVPQFRGTAMKLLHLIFGQCGEYHRQANFGTFEFLQKLPLFWVLQTKYFAFLLENASPTIDSASKEYNVHHFDTMHHFTYDKTFTAFNIQRIGFLSTNKT